MIAASDRMGGLDQQTLRDGPLFRGGRRFFETPGPTIDRLSDIPGGRTAAPG